MIEYPFENLERTKRLDNFTRMVEEAEDGEGFIITRNGARMAVVIGAAEHALLLAAVRSQDA